MIRPSPLALAAHGRAVVATTSSSVANTRSAAASLVAASESLHPPHRRWHRHRSPPPPPHNPHLRRWYRRTPSLSRTGIGGDGDGDGDSASARGGGGSPERGEDYEEEEEPSSEILLAHYEGRRPRGVDDGQHDDDDLDIFTRILSAAEIELGRKDVAVASPEVLAELLRRVDEFHVGGREATDRLLSSVASVAAGIGITSSTPSSDRKKAILEVLDLGCGLGGPARRVASFLGPECSVVGIDLSPEFVDCARRLTELTCPDDGGRRGNLSFLVGSILDLPFEDDRQFDLVTMMHVGMNVLDKNRLFREVARVLRPQGGLFAVYDLVDTTVSRGGETSEGERAVDGDGDVGGPPPPTAELRRLLRYPVPWASEPSHSFVSTAETYRHAAHLSGLDLVHEIDRGDEAREFFRKQRRRLKQHRGESSAPPPQPPRLDISLVLGEDAEEKMKNVARAVESGVVSPVEFIFRKREVHRYMMAEGAGRSGHPSLARTHTWHPSQSPRIRWMRPRRHRSIY